MNSDVTTTTTTTTTKSESPFQQPFYEDEDGNEVREKGEEVMTTSMPSLDVVLAKARKKKLIIPMATIQSFMDQPFWIFKLPSKFDLDVLLSSNTDTTTCHNKSSSEQSTTTNILAIFTRMDILLIFISAFILDANGFALGYIISKLTIRSVTKLLNLPPSIQSVLLPSWIVIWSIGLDQII